MKIIPFDPSISSWQTFSVNLGELVCKFDIRWNGRCSSWFCDFSTSTGTNYSVRLAENRPLLGRQNSTGLSGDFRVCKMSRMADDEISYANFGSDWKLVYGTNDEWSVVDGV